MTDIFDLIPKDKFDHSNLETIKTIDADKIKPILGQLLEWIQDLNWPVAQELFHILPRFHVELIPHIKAVFASDDDIWKHWTLCLIKAFPPETVSFLSSDIKRIATHPTAGETSAETNICAIEVIQLFDL